MLKGPNQMNARFNAKMGTRPRSTNYGSWQISDAQRAQIQAAAKQVGDALRRPETINAIRTVSARLGALYGRK